jgi:hypothetical protein
VFRDGDIYDNVQNAIDEFDSASDIVFRDGDIYDNVQNAIDEFDSASDCRIAVLKKKIFDNLSQLLNKKVGFKFETMGISCEHYNDTETIDGLLISDRTGVFHFSYMIWVTEDLKQVLKLSGAHIQLNSPFRELLPVVHRMFPCYDVILSNQKPEPISNVR